jgi:hypothetical protein
MVNGNRRSKSVDNEGRPRSRYAHTEYGGGEGSPRRGPDGALLPLKQIPGAIGDAARVVRTVGARGDFSGTERLNPDGTPVVSDKNAVADLEAKTNGYRNSAGDFGERIV